MSGERSSTDPREARASCAQADDGPEGSESCESQESQESLESQEGAVLDARGLRCPEPVMLLHKAIAPLGAGDALTVLATDPTTQRDIPQFCRFLGHELRETRQQHDEFVFTLIKGA